MFFIEKKPEKPNIGKIVAISVGVTFAIAAAAYGVYMFCRKYCSLCKCDDTFLDDDFDCDCLCDCDCEDCDDADLEESEDVEF
ncbi:MAG: hypothetical protein E7671_02055 [Ruminococcaceae bacterium]|nr:hypothetical protein [Oscillospiraceae bacterium]